jgi:hypothetical protein
MLKSANRRTGASAADRTSSRRAVLRQGLKWVASLVLLGGLGIGVWCVAVAEKLPPSETPAHAITNALLHPVVIRRPEGPPMLPTGLTNFQGQPVLASCSACHTTTQPNIDTRRAEDLRQFHQGLEYNHGNLTCLSCHNSTDYDTLRLADTRSVAFVDSIDLCSQCHGPQRRDYDMGLHGGMNGHWDLTRGGRTRNTCINCHDPHVPAFPLVLPVLPPRDRVSVQKSSASSAHSSEAQHP